MTSWDGSDLETLARFRTANDYNTARHYAAFAAYRYVRAWEARGERPEMKQVRSGKQSAQFLNPDDPEAGWRELEKAILDVIGE
jgi:hypothetical protein